MSHIRGTRKSAYLLTCFFVLLPLAYLATTVNNGTFDAVFFRYFLMAMLLAGIVLSITVATVDYYLTERLKNKLNSLDLGKLGDQNFQLMDHYTGWSRTIEMEGTYDNRKVWIDHRFEKGDWRLTPYLTIAVAPINRIILEIEVDSTLTAEHIDEKIREALASAKAC